MVANCINEERIEELKKELSELIKLRDQKRTELSALEKEINTIVYTLTSIESYRDFLIGK